MVVGVVHVAVLVVVVPPELVGKNENISDPKMFHFLNWEGRNFVEALFLKEAAVAAEGLAVGAFLAAAFLVPFPVAACLVAFPVVACLVAFVAVACRAEVLAGGFVAVIN